MSYQKLIHEYLDQGLKGPQEEVLFAELSSSTELRTEFNQQVKFHSLVQSDMATIAPPLETTETLFASLGFSTSILGDTPQPAPVPTPEPVVTQPAATGVWASLKNHLPTMLTAVFSAAVTSFVIMYFLNDAPVSNQASVQTKSNIPVVSSSETQNLTSNNQLNNLTPAAPINNQASQVKTVYRNVYIPVLPETKEEKVAEPIAINQTNTIDNNYLELNGMNTQEFGGFGQKPSILEADFSDILPIDNSKFEFQFQTINNYDVQPSKMKSMEGLIPVNWRVSGYYEIFEDFQLGIELGQESFTQKFKNMEGGKLRLYDQNPLTTFYGASAKWNIKDLDIYNVAHPYIQGFVGVADGGLFEIYGALVKGQGGLTLKPFNNHWSLNIGFEYSSLLYSNAQNNILNSDKYGVSWGVSYNP